MTNLHMHRDSSGKFTKKSHEVEDWQTQTQRNLVGMHDDVKNLYRKVWDMEERLDSHSRLFWLMGICIVVLTVLVIGGK